MRIGSYRSAIILASDHMALAFLVIMPMILAVNLGCKPATHEPPSLSQHIDYVQDQNNNHFQTFLTAPIHVEIEPIGEMSQVFYHVDPKMLALTPIRLRKTVHITGLFNDFESLFPHDDGSDFLEIIAMPVMNNLGFLSPRIPFKKSRILKTGFHLTLHSDLAYVLALNPSGDLNHAPIYENLGIIKKDSRVDLALNDQPIIVTGHLMLEDGNDNLRAVAKSEFVTNEAFRHARLRARIMQGSRLISSVGTIKEDGSFSLERANSLMNDQIGQPINLVIEPIDPESPWPRIKRKLSISDLEKNIHIDEISVGRLKKPRSITIEVHGSDDSKIANAFLYLHAKIGAGETLIKKQVDRSGTTQFPELYEGTYDIAVIPPSESKFAMRIIKAVDFGANDFSQISIDLQKREPLEALVLSHAGHPVSGSQIELSRIGESGNLATEDIYDDMLFKFIATTNEDGRICDRKFGFTTSDKNECESLLLDDGRYLAHIIPPAGTELAHQWLTFDFPTENKLAITLGRPEILSGQILAFDGYTPVRHAFITIYLGKTLAHNQPKIIGNAITDDRGYFQAFVSAP